MWEFADRWLTAWTTTCSWTPDAALRGRFPPRHADYRDFPPPAMPDVYAAHRDLVREGRWTLGLWDCWAPRAKHVKAATHLPCWDSFRVNPCAWRGVVFGRTCEECYWDGLRQMRWARTVYAAGLGREYVLPVRGVGRHGYRSDLKALCWMYYLMGCVFSCGVGQVFSLCGNCCFNFSAWYSCHAREKLRRRYRLPPALGCPPGVDDFIVHFFCLYCAVYQEMRELAVRGVDGPGLHILDVLPGSYVGAEGGAAAVAARAAAVDAMVARPPKMFVSRPRRGEREAAVTAREVKEGAVAALHRAAAALLGRDRGDDSDGDAASEASAEGPLGWRSYCALAPCVQEMSRGMGPRTRSLPGLLEAGLGGAAAAEWAGGDAGPRLSQAERGAALERAWSIVY